VALFYDHAYFHLPVRERIQQIRDALHFHDRSHREQWNESFQEGSDAGPPVTDGHVILGPDTRETIRQVRRELALLDFEGGGGKGRAALEILESLPTWHYVVQGKPDADLSLTTVVNDLDVLLHLLPATSAANVTPITDAGQPPPEHVGPSSAVITIQRDELESNVTRQPPVLPQTQKQATLIGGKLHDARKRRGHKQEHIAELLNVDVSTISRWERGDQEPSEQHRPRILAYIDQELDTDSK
jgi:DNA-binding transcriptional regulator YiaG